LKDKRNVDGGGAEGKEGRKVVDVEGARVDGRKEEIGKRRGRETRAVGVEGG